MKKLSLSQCLFLGLILLGTTSNGNAQENTEKEVPEQAQSHFQHHYPMVKLLEWKTDDKKHTVSALFEEGGYMRTAVYKNGIYQRTDVEVPKKFYPKKAVEAVMDSCGVKYKIKEVFVESQNNQSCYRIVAVKGKGKSMETRYFYVSMYEKKIFKEWKPGEPDFRL